MLKKMLKKEKEVRKENVIENFFTSDGNEICNFIAEAGRKCRQVENILNGGEVKGIRFISKKRIYEFWFYEGQTRIVVKEMK